MNGTIGGTFEQQGTQLNEMEIIDQRGTVMINGETDSGVLCVEVPQRREDERMSDQGHSVLLPL